MSDQELTLDDAKQKAYEAEEQINEILRHLGDELNAGIEIEEFAMGVDGLRIIPGVRLIVKVRG